MLLFGTSVEWDAGQRFPESIHHAFKHRIRAVSVLRVADDFFRLNKETRPTGIKTRTSEWVSGSDGVLRPIFATIWLKRVCCLLYLHVRNNQSRWNKTRNSKNLNFGTAMTFFEKFRQNSQILKFWVSVSNFKARVSECFMTSRSQTFKSRQYHCYQVSSPISERERPDRCLECFLLRLLLLQALAIQWWDFIHTTATQQHGRRKGFSRGEVKVVTVHFNSSAQN